MDEKLLDEVLTRLRRKESPARIRAALVESGYAEQDIDEAMRSRLGVHLDERDHDDKHNSRLFSVRETLDRFGYGAASPQFINILFWLSGAGIFLVGLINGLRTVISMLITSVLQEYTKVHRVSRTVIGSAGIVFGFSFLAMAFAVRAHAVWLFAVAILCMGIGVVTYGDLYNKLVLETLRREKMGAVLRRMGQFGVLITMVSMLLSGWLIDRFPETGGVSFTVLGMRFTPVGYLISFEITAFAFIISGYLLNHLREKREERRYPLAKFIREHLKALKENRKEVAKNKYIMLLLAATAITGLLEVLGQSYYGIFIYQNFKDVAFGGFLNVAVLYALAIITSFTGPWFTHFAQRAIGLTPMLVFGTLLTAILPLTLVFNANIAAVGVALLLAVIGGGMLGVAQGLLARKLMDEATRRRYFMSLGLLLALPYILLIPLGSYLTSIFGMERLFFVIGLGLAIVVAPIYFVLVAFANKQRL